MLTKERFKPQLSKSAWEALRNASMAGTSDKDLAEVYEIAETAIRKRRSDDKTWAVAHGLRRKVLGAQGAVSKHVKAITLSHEGTQKEQKEAENQAIQAIVSTFADENAAARLLALQIGQKGLKASLHGDGSLKAHLEPTEPAHVKVYAEIAAKAGQWGGETQVTVNCAAYAGASVHKESTEGEASIVDL